MASFFFPRTVYQTEAPFTPFLRFLDDIEKQSRLATASTPSRSSCHAYRTAHPRRRYAPRFDIRETDDAYVLNGELPGLTRDQVAVEFPEPRTLVVRGQFDTEPKPAEKAVEEKLVDDDDAATDVASSTEDTASRKSYQATVEDDGDDFEVVDQPAGEKQPLVEKTQTPAAEKKPEQQQQQPAELNHFWLQERRAGNFSRTFRFASYVDHDGVTASLKDGILEVVVPKAPKPETHRISVN